MPAVKSARFLADEITSLLDPTPEGDFDPETDPAVDDAARVIADADFVADEREFELRGKLRMRGGLDDLDERYPSKPISRKRWERQFSGSKPVRASSVDADDESVEAEEAEEAGESEEEDEDGEANGHTGRRDAEVWSGSEIEEDSDEDGADDADGTMDGAARPTPGSLQAEWLQLQAEEAALARKLAAEAREEVTKATEAAAQHAAWEQVFNIRILLHKALTAANQTPDPALRPHFAAHSEEVSLAYAQCAQSALGLLTDMLALNGSLGAPSGASGGEGEWASGPHARELERLVKAAEGTEPAALMAAAWRLASEQTEGSMTAHLSSLDEWSARTGLSAPLAGSERKFKAFHRSIGAQVDAALSDPERVRARAHTVRSGRRPLGLRAVPGVGAPRALADGEELRCLHVYDDIDLYHAQLKVRARLASAPTSLKPGFAQCAACLHPRAPAPV